MSTSSNLTSILQIIQIALGALAVIPAVGAPAAEAQAMLGLLQAGLAAYHQASGSPLDITKLTLETPVA
jgi:hypothetical protein